jgi:hypothetical protein
VPYRRAGDVQRSAVDADEEARLSDQGGERFAVARADAAPQRGIGIGIEDPQAIGQGRALIPIEDHRHETGLDRRFAHTLGQLVREVLLIG